MANAALFVASFVKGNMLAVDLGYNVFAAGGAEPPRNDKYVIDIAMCSNIMPKTPRKTM